MKVNFKVTMKVIIEFVVEIYIGNDLHFFEKYFTWGNIQPSQDFLDTLYTRWPILIYNPKYLLKYFIYEKKVPAKVDPDRGGHFTAPSILTLRSIFKVKWG